ncbi:NADP-dependent oxidoreductase [Microbacterium esteraromaticum]|uniref:NADP-dependent oxidoreductase n=1 Tax=Microbacterium esteraromaticum TaxID=57043 RepID=A0A7D7WFT9_9MICO|nr:NADP-dependent oxidoreductase [Microbacterium esteraromaticum]QMU97111.1 NADP-dependent oxidoreductase [Microbacterium esteraromaticum]
MRAVVYDRFTKDLDALEVRDLPEPKLAPASVLIEVRAAGVNPVDWKLMAGGLDAIMPTQFPVIPGWDVAGVVAAVGMDTPEFQVGDEVMAYARKDSVSAGTFAERVAVPVSAVARKPASLTWEQAGALPLAGGTALRAVDALGDLTGRTVLIHGAAGGVGGFAVQIAASRGAKVIATASERNHDYVRALGGEPTTYGDGLGERVRAIAGGSVDAVADFVGGMLETTLDVLADGGAHVSIADPSVVRHGGRHIWVRPDGTQTARLAELADRKLLRIEVAETFPLERVADAFRASQSGHTRGKLVIVP